MKIIRNILLIIVGITILGIFGYISYINLFPEKKLDIVRKIEDINSPKIDNIKLNNGILKINTNNAKKICIKSTRSNPNKDSICFVNLINDSYETTIYDYKIYYIWLMDNNGNISEKIEYNPMEN